MSLPNFPNITPRISITIGQAVPLLLGSIALEELALAHIINAEAEKIQFVLGTLTPSRALTPPTVTISNLLAINQDVRRTLQDVIKKEMLLQFKFENVLDLVTSQTPSGGGRTFTFSNSQLIGGETFTFSNSHLIEEGTFTFSNPQLIRVFEGPQTRPYPSTINVSNVPGTITQVTVELNRFTNVGDSPSDIMVLVVAPDGSNVLIMSHVGDLSSVFNTDIIFDDDASDTIGAKEPIASNTTTILVQPSVAENNHPLPPPAPQAVPYSTTLSTFNGLNPNGTWSLFVSEESASGDATIRDGWTLNITTA